MAAPLLPAWLANSNRSASSLRPPPSPSVTLTLSPSTAAAPPPRFQIEKGTPLIVDGQKAASSDLSECCQELEERHQAWAAHRKEAAWRLRRVELQLDAEKALRRREKIEEIEAKVRDIREEQVTALERIDAEYKEQLMVLKRDADAKEQKLADQWAAKHARLSRLLDQVGCFRY